MSDNHYVPNREISPEVAAIIASFRQPTYTVAEMEGDGFTHVMGVCSACGSIVMNPFRLLRARNRVADATTLAQLSAAYRCSKCGGRETQDGMLQPAYQYMGSAADTDANSPVNRRLRFPVQNESTLAGEARSDGPCNSE